MPEQTTDNAPTEIKVWACTVKGCGYWRQERSTGIHQAPNPEDPRWHYVTHELTEVTYRRATPEDVTALQEDR
jgi:hypothetical protein